MKVTVNGKEIVVPETANILTLLECLDLSERNGLAIAIEQKVIPKSEWFNYILSKNTKITLIQATQGG